MATIDEDELVKAIRRHGTSVLRFARSQLPSMQDAEDIYQETFRTLYRSAPQFADDEHLRRWLFAAASNHCKHFYRTRARKGFDVLDPQSSSFQGLVDGREGRFTSDYTSDHEVWEYVNLLPRDQREAIELFYVEGYFDGGDSFHSQGASGYGSRASFPRSAGSQENDEERRME